MSAFADIAMQLTPPGTGAIAVVRLVGPRVRGFLERRFTKPVGLRRCVHGELRDGDRVIDDAVVVLCDDLTADLNLHGGAWIVRSVLDLAGRDGFELRRSSPGAPLPVEMVDAETLLEREVLQYLPMARTEAGVRALLAQNQAWRDLNAIFELETAQTKPGAERSGAPDPRWEELDHILTDQTLVHLLFPPTVAIVGPANVGKSTLANQLFARARSITADVPGTTRDWVGEFANVDGLPVMLVDTPGLRATQDPIEQIAIEHSGHEIGQAQLVILVVDASRELAGEQQSLMARFPGGMLVVNKVDRPAAAGMQDLRAIRTVATTGYGIDELRGKIVEHFCGRRTIATDRPGLWTPRQREIVARVIQHQGSLDQFLTG